MNFGEMIFLLLLGLVVFGPRRLPEIAKTVGRIVGDLKHAGGEVQGKITREIEDLELAQPAKVLSSVANRVSAVNAAANPARAVMALVETNPPTQQSSRVSLLDNVNRIKEILANSAAATGVNQVEVPSAATLLSNENPPPG